MRTLLVDHHAKLAQVMQAALLDYGFTVDVVPTLEEASVAFGFARYEFLLLELALPDGCALGWLKRLRREGHSIPAIIMSSLDDRDTRIAIFNGGADDFLPKPVSTDELIARIRAVLRRSRQEADSDVTFGNLTFDPIGRQVSVGGQPLKIPRRELCILEHLLTRAGRTSQRELLLGSLYAFDDEVTSNALDVGIYRLRALLGASGATLLIRTVRGIGYALELNERAPKP
ncbi:MULTISPECIES: response regulator transcription factor [unclassified Mesorhizobium]|uniref:Response regulator transcription factor n=1 Tax=Mesorhizobium salmacidum TaxID=3015171 RepID=A0ABU8L2C6_9HYPH|nr:response regulator transcription factor [Mesorhizobium sp. WSM3626]